MKDVRELIAYARSNPGKLNFGIGSNGSAGHLAQELLRSGAGVDIVMVPYKGSSPAYVDLIGGRLQGFTDPVHGALPQVQGGTVRALAVTSSKRLSVLPDVPTVAESGVPGFEFHSWYGLWGPANLPRPVVDRLNAEINRWIASPERSRTIRAARLRNASRHAGGFRPLRSRRFCALGEDHSRRRHQGGMMARDRSKSG